MEIVDVSIWEGEHKNDVVGPLGHKLLMVVGVLLCRFLNLHYKVAYKVSIKVDIKNFQVYHIKI